MTPEALCEVIDSVGFDYNIGMKEQLFNKHAHASVVFPISIIRNYAAVKQRWKNMNIAHISGFPRLSRFYPKHMPHKDLSLSQTFDYRSFV